MVDAVRENYGDSGFARVFTARVLDLFKKKKKKTKR